MSRLETDRIIAITDLPAELLEAIKTLTDSGDDFLDHLHEYSQEE